MTTGRKVPKIQAAFPRWTATDRCWRRNVVAATVRLICLRSKSCARLPTDCSFSPTSLLTVAICFIDFFLRLLQRRRTTTFVSAHTLHTIGNWLCILDIWLIATFLLACYTQTVYFQLLLTTIYMTTRSMFYVYFVKIAVKIAVCQFYFKWISINKN